MRTSSAQLEGLTLCEALESQGRQFVWSSKQQRLNQWQESRYHLQALIKVHKERLLDMQMNRDAKSRSCVHQCR
jgi:hypothetical protein